MNVRILKQPVVVLLAVFFLLVVGTIILQLAAESPEIPQADKKEIQSNPGQYVSVAWVEDWLVVDFRGVVEGTPASPAYNVGRLWRLRADGSDMSLLDIPIPDACKESSTQSKAPSGLLAPRRLADGRVGLIVECPKSPNSPLTDLYMMAFEMRSGKAEQLLPYAVSGMRFAVAGYSWNPELTKAIATDGNGLAEKLYWLTPEKLVPLALPFSRAITPAWSPDSKTIAFWATPERGLQGINKAESKFNLFMMESDGSNMRPVLTGFRYPLSMAWSRDSTRLVFAATSANDDKEGIWLHTLGDGATKLILPGSYTSLSWASDNREVVAIEFIPDGSGTRLVRVSTESGNTPEPATPNN